MELENNTSRELVILENDPQVPAGLVAEMLAGFRIPYRVIRAHRGEPLPEPGAPTAIIVLGGAMGVGETERYPFLLDVKRFVRACAHGDVPFLGICLGGQLLAEALGAAVTSHRYGEQGVCGVALTGAGGSDPLFRGITGEFTSFQWHNDSFGLPEGAILLAGSSVCPHQAIRFGSRIYGLQFHPEVTPAIVAAWVEAEAGPVETGTAIIHDFHRAATAFAPTSHTILTNFFRIAGLLSP